MKTVLRLSTCMLMVAALAACNESGDGAAAADATAAPTAAESAGAPQPAPASTTAAEAGPVVLSMDRVRAYLQAHKNLKQAVQADPSVGDPTMNASEEDTEGYAARLEASPKMREAIEAAGLSAAEFARTGETLVNAMMAQGAVEAGVLKDIPEGIDPAAVEFVKQNQAELQSLMKAAAG